MPLLLFSGVRSQESTVINGDSRRANWGLAAGFMIAVVALVGSFVVILQGHEIYGLFSIIISIGSVAGVFVYGSIARKQERQAKSPSNGQARRR